MYGSIDSSDKKKKKETKLNPFIINRILSNRMNVKLLSLFFPI